MFLVWTDFDSYDIHVLRNSQPSVDIEKLVSVVVERQVEYDGALKKKTSIFTAVRLRTSGILSTFKSVAFFPSWVVGETFPVTPNPIVNGISVDVATGKVTAQTLPPNTQHTITSFGIRVVLFFADEHGTVVAHPQHLKLLVHVHNSITKVWTTPSQLNVRPDIIKGIFIVQLNILTAETIKKVKLYKTDAFTEVVDADFLFNPHPFEFPPNPFIKLTSSDLLDNRDLFRDTRVFYDPLHLEVSYVASDRISQLTIPLHHWHLIKKDQILKDNDGKDVFKVGPIAERRQYQLSVYATFDDETIGDITNWHELTWEHGTGFVGDDIDFGSGGYFKVPVASVGKTIEVRAKLPPALSSATITETLGKVKVEPSWLTMDLVAKPVPQSPVHQDPEAVNLLFISEGFDTEIAFSNIARDLCKQLREEHKTAPWNHLFKSAINCWMLFQPSEETGGTILYETLAFKEIELVNKGKDDLALPFMDVCGLGPPLSNQVTFHQFISRVGVPVKADLNTSKAVKLAAWQALFGADIGSGNWSISDEVFNYWKKLAQERTLVEERNTAFGIACGSKPTLIPKRPSRVPVLNDEARLDYQHINLMLSRVRANSITGNLIGEKFWGRDKTGKLGKDFGLLIFLTNGLIESGVRMGQQYYPQGEVNQGISIGLSDDKLLSLDFLSKDLKITYPYFKWKKLPATPAIVIDPFVNVKISISAYSTVAHELGHFFNLRDEYAEKGNGASPANPKLDSSYNVQHLSSLLEGNKISGDKVKWRWPRIRKAAVLAADPVLQSGNLTVTVKSQQAVLFKMNEEVHLRKKNVLQNPLDKLVSPKLKIININKDVLTLQNIQDAAFTGIDFGRGSLLVLLTKASTLSENNPTQDEYAELMSSMIRKKINDTHKSQTKEPCEEDLKMEQQPTNLAADIANPDNSSQIVGLYAGGDTYSCDIFHPTGQCLMRADKGLNATSRINLFTEKREFQFHNVVLPFCPVCRYSLVDQIDPTQHDKIDKLYDGDYPATSWYSRNAGKFWLSVLGGVGVGVGIYLLTKDK